MSDLRIVCTSFWRHALFVNDWFVMCCVLRYSGSKAVVAGLEGEDFVGNGVCESDAAGVQMEPGIFPVFCPYASASPVQLVSEDGSAEAQDMGRVDPELVGASCVGMEEDVCRTVFVDCQHFIFRLGRLSL